MRRKLMDDIEIVEPPIEELAKKHGRFTRACSIGCGSILVFLVLVVVGLRLAAGPGPQTLRTVPDDFPADIPVYDRNNIENITLITGKYKNRGLEVAAIIPKIVLSPLLLRLNKDMSPADTNADTTIKKQADYIRSLWRVIATPVGDHRDTIQLEWVELDATPSFIASYYKNELKKKQFTIDVESEGKDVKQFSFSRSDGLSGSLYIKSQIDNKSKLQQMILTVNVGEVIK